MRFDFYQIIYFLRKSLMKKIGVLLFFCTCKCHKVLNYEYKKEKKGKLMRKLRGGKSKERGR